LSFRLFSFYGSDSFVKPQALTDFWTRLKLVEVKEDSKFIDVSPAYIFGDPDLRSIFFIRDDYKHLYSLLISYTKQEPPRYHYFTIKGSPGVGKSTFAAFLMYCHHTIGPIVYQPRGSKQHVFVYGKDSVERVVTSDFKLEPLYLNPNCLYIVDGHIPSYGGHVRCITVLITSPNKSLISEFSKAGAVSLVMPTWSYEEIEECQQVAFSQLTREEVKESFFKWGGNPRYVLQFAKETSHQIELEQALESTDLKKLQDSIGAADRREDISDRLVHMVVLDAPDDYIHYSIRFASNYIGEKVVEALLRKNEEELIEFLSASDGKGDVGSLRGILFEPFVHRLLAAGGSFEIRSLDGGPATAAAVSADVLTLPHLNRTMIGKLDDIRSLIPADYGVPNSRSFAAIDSLCSPNLLFQSTISLHHPISMSGIEKVVNCLDDENKQPEYRLYFAVPETIFSDYKLQDYHTKERKVAVKLNNAVRKVKQYALKIVLTRTGTGSSSFTSEEIKRRKLTH
jgi:broad-specificity NMP kinase